MSTSPIRLNPTLITAAERAGLVQKRSTPKQIEYWADLGRAVEGVIDRSDVFAVLQGLKRLKLEDTPSATVNPDDLFRDLQKRVEAGRFSDEVTTSVVYFEASRKHPGMLDRVDAVTGFRQAGQFRDGKFHALVS